MSFMMRTILAGLLLVHFAAAQCPTTPPGKDSGPSDEKTKECNLPPIMACRTGASSTPSSPAASSSSAPAATPAASTDSSTAGSSTASMAATTAASASSATSASSAAEPCPCTLMDELVNMMYIYLNVTQQIKFNACLNNVRSALIDITLGPNEKVSKIGYHIEVCFIANPDIKDKLKFKMIANWGYVYQFCAAGKEFDSVKLSSLVTPLDASGRSNLTQALLDGTANDKCGVNTTAAMVDIVGKMDYMNRKQTPGYDKGRKLGWFKRAIEGYLYVQYPTMQSCLSQLVIPGYGSFDQFMNLCQQYMVSSSMGTTVLNGTASQCVMIQSISTALQSPAVTSSNNQSVLTEANTFLNTITSLFTANTDFQVRLSLLVSNFEVLSPACRQLVNSFKMLISSISSLSIDFSDVLVANNYCVNQGCGNITYGPPSESQDELIMIDPVYNISDVEYGCQVFYDYLHTVGATNTTGNGTTPAQNGFKSYFNAIRNCGRSTLYSGNYTAKYLCMKPQVCNYANNNPAYRTKFLSTQLFGMLIDSITSVAFGTFSIVFGC